jgi:hypothetical protein
MTRPACPGCGIEIAIVRPLDPAQVVGQPGQVYLQICYHCRGVARYQLGGGGVELVALTPAEFAELLADPQIAAEYRAAMEALRGPLPYDQVLDRWRRRLAR